MERLSIFKEPRVKVLLFMATGMLEKLEGLHSLHRNNSQNCSNIQTTQNSHNKFYYMSSMVLILSC